MNIAAIKRSIAVCNSLEDLKAISGACWKRKQELEAQQRKAGYRAEWDRLEGEALRRGDIIYLAEETTQISFDGPRPGAHTLPAGTELTVIGVQPRAQRIFVESPGPEWVNARWRGIGPCMYLDTDRLRILRLKEKNRSTLP